MDGNYDLWRVMLSLGIAVLASYVTLDIVSRIASVRGSRAAVYWLIGGALSMGTGIWSTHFIGMLALELPIPLKVIAEGVETQEQEKILRLLRCDEIQGYFVSRPLTAEALPGFLNRNQMRLAQGERPRPATAING